MLSYAQNAEDVVLARAFGDRPGGFYVDVGASHPELGSVTKHFYDRGWHGVNVEPDPASYALLCEARPRDVNLRLALSDRAGRARLYQPSGAPGGGSTLRADLAARLRHADAALVEVDVELLTLADVCARHAGGAIDFLKIDVEGSEEEVIRGGDWARYRPRVVLVEATEPGSAVPSHAAWEPLLLAVRYQLALFDGLNRFYVRAEDAALMPRLAVPANVHDAWEPHRYVTKIMAMERHAAELEARLAEQERYAADVREHFERCQAWAKVLEDKVRRLEGEEKGHVTELEAQLAQRERYAVDVREHFERCQAWVKVLEDKVRRLEGVGKEGQVAELEAQLAERGRYAADVQRHFDRCQAWVKVLEDKVRRFEDHLGLLPGTLPPPRPGSPGEDLVRSR